MSIFPSAPRAAQAGGLVANRKDRTMNVTIYLEGGVIQDVEKDDEDTVLVYDYDVEGEPEEKLDRDKYGRRCCISKW